MKKALISGKLTPKTTTKKDLVIMDNARAIKGGKQVKWKKYIVIYVKKRLKMYIKLLKMLKNVVYPAI